MIARLVATSAGCCTSVSTRSSTGVVEAELLEVESGRLAAGLEDGHRLGHGLGDVASHPGLERALAREHEGDLAHAATPPWFHSISAEPQVRPAPIPVISTNSPSRRRPSVCGVGERERNRAGRRVAVAIDVDDDLLLRDPELPRCVVDDPHVRLVRDVDVDSSTVRPHSFSTFSADETITRVANLNTSRPFIFTSRSASSKRREPLPGSQRCSPPPPSAPELEAEEAAVVDALEHDRPGAVAEEHERRAVRPSRGSSRARRRRRRAPSAPARPRASRRPGRSRTRSRCSRRGGRRPRRRASRARRPGARSVVGNIMSGVTVAQMSRSISSGLVPASLERGACGRQRDVGQRLVLARRTGARGCPCARRSTRPTCRRAAPARRSSDHALGHVHAEAGDPDPPSVGRCRSRRPVHGEGERAADGELAVDGRARLALADRAAHRLEIALQRQLVAGAHDPLEADVVDAGEERDLARGSPPRTARRRRRPARAPRPSSRPA